LIDLSSVFKLIGSSIDYSSSVWGSYRSFTVIDFAGGGTSSGIFSLDTSLAGSFAGEGDQGVRIRSGDISVASSRAYSDILFQPLGRG
jgi:hypothetical protein